MSGKIVLVVAAHPDDEVLGCGGTIARHAAEGDTVYVLFMTDGVTSRFEPCEIDAPSIKVVEAIQTRAVAARRAVAILGCRLLPIDIYPADTDGFLEFEDQRLDTYKSLELAKKIAEVALPIAPNIVYTHHHGDLNADHRLTHEAVRVVFRPQPGSSLEAIYAFEIPSSTEWGSPKFEPDTFVDLSGTHVAKKYDALMAYGMELREAPHPRSLSRISHLQSVRGSTAGVQCAEAFKTVFRVV